MELRLAEEAAFLAAHGARCLVGVSPFEGRDAWLDGVLARNHAAQRFEFDPPPFFEEWPWRRTNFARARITWPPRLRAASIDLAHIFYAWTQEGGSRLWLCHHAGIPCVLSIHNAFPPAELSPWHERLTRQGFAGVRGLYGVTQSALDHFMATYGRYVPDDAVIEVVPNFVDIHRFVPSHERRKAFRDALGIPHDAHVIGSVGRLDVQKQPLQVLGLFERLWRQRDDLYLVFCGQGPLADTIRNRVKGTPWADRIRMLGFRSDAENVFPALDVHVLLSKREGFGISTIEAMACGVPVVATNVPGTRDILADSPAGSLVPLDDPEGTAQTVGALLWSPELRRRMGEAGRQLAVTRYSKACWSNRLMHFYRAVLRNQTGRKSKTS